jgi:hypothetical protein
MRGLRGNGASILSSYPYSSSVTFADPLAALSLRLERSKPYSDEGRCAAAQALQLDPVPTVARVTGPLSSHPAYGFYVLRPADTTDYEALIYR